MIILDSGEGHENNKVSNGLESDSGGTLLLSLSGKSSEVVTYKMQPPDDMGEVPTDLGKDDSKQRGCQVPRLWNANNTGRFVGEKEGSVTGNHWIR